MPSGRHDRPGQLDTRRLYRTGVPHHRKYIPPAAGVKSPALWGTQERLQELFGTQAALLQVNRRSYAFRYRSPEHWLETFRTTYGPLLKTFEALDTARQAELSSDLLALCRRLDRGGDSGAVIESEYLEVVMRRS